MPIDLHRPEAEIDKAVDGTLHILREMLRNGELNLIIQWSLTLVTAILILIAARLLGTILSRRIENARRIDPTLASFLGTFARYAIMAVAIITILGQFGVQTASLLAVLGAAGLAIGLALQGTLSNVAAGVMLLILRPFRVGDFITVGNLSGTVKTLGLFGTELATADNVYIFAPNSRLWNNDIVNYNRLPLRRQDITIRLHYSTDLDKAFAVISEIIAAEPRLIQNDESKKPQIMVNNMGEIALEIIVRFWSKREDYWPLRYALMRQIKESLEDSAIPIPTLPLTPLTNPS